MVASSWMARLSHQSRMSLRVKAPVLPWTTPKKSWKLTNDTAATISGGGSMSIDHNV